NDVDGVETILTSPVFTLVGVENPAISYFRWFYNNDAADVGNYLITEVSNDGGGSWTLVENLSAGSGGWQYREFDPTDYVAATANMRLRFRAADKTPDDIVEAGIDDFRVFSATCPCPADFDGTGFVDTDDFDAFVQAFEGGLDAADFDGTGFVDTDDFDAFVQAFESGC
ncbi:MAG TPA: GC-type dockerin domain-anchored protein, partial [Phycisphaerales bacterium]|nr:GC-type dockerin domain-anchored protein [Phycisphaerales bacterium]